MNCIVIFAAAVFILTLPLTAEVVPYNYRLPDGISFTDRSEDEFIMLQTYGSRLNVSKVLADFSGYNASALESLVIDLGILPRGTCVLPDIYPSLATSYLKAAKAAKRQELALLNLKYGTADRSRWSYEDLLKSISCAKTAGEISSVKRLIMLKKVQELRAEAVDKGLSYAPVDGIDPLYAAVDDLCRRLDSPGFGGYFDDNAVVSEWIPDEATVKIMSEFVLADPEFVSVYGGPLLAALGVNGYNSFISNSVFAVISDVRLDELRKEASRPVDPDSGDAFCRKAAPSTVESTISFYRPASRQRAAEKKKVNVGSAKCEFSKPLPAKRSAPEQKAAPAKRVGIEMSEGGPQ